MALKLPFQGSVYKWPIIGQKIMDAINWHSDPSAICPVCQLPRGHHYNAFCVSAKGMCPSYDYSMALKDAVPVPGPDQPLGRYGVRIIYAPDGTWKFADPSEATPASTCHQVKDKVGAPINDHVCPTCRNDRCSKTEKSCWKCGGKL
jgi:hypothetical protein